MATWFKSWFDYGRCGGVARALFDEDGAQGRGPPRGPSRQQTEAEIVADEKRYDEDARRLAAADEKRAAR